MHIGTPTDRYVTNVTKQGKGCVARKLERHKANEAYEVVEEFEHANQHSPVSIVGVQ